MVLHRPKIRCNPVSPRSALTRREIHRTSFNISLLFCLVTGYTHDTHARDDTTTYRGASQPPRAAATVIHLLASARPTPPVPPCMGWAGRGRECGGVRGGWSSRGQTGAWIREVNYEFFNLIMDAYFAIDTVNNGRFLIHIFF